MEQRARSFDYIKHVHTGDTHWLSTVALGPQEQSMTKAVDSMQGAAHPALARTQPASH